MKPTPHFLHTVKKAAVLWKALLRTLTLGGRASGLREQNQVGICPGCAGNYSQHPQEAAWGELEWSCEEGRGQGRPPGRGRGGGSASVRETSCHVTIPYGCLSSTDLQPDWKELKQHPQILLAPFGLSSGLRKPLRTS